MFLIRDVFRCKPGKARELAEKLRSTLPSSEREDGFRNCRLLVDFVATYWTVVWEAEIESLQQFEHHMDGYSGRPEVRAAMAGYLDLVDGGHREIFRVLT
jgi:heme-degrading monooxygenase HmoA